MGCCASIVSRDGSNPHPNRSVRQTNPSLTVNRNATSTHPSSIPAASAPQVTSHNAAIPSLSSSAIPTSPPPASISGPGPHSPMGLRRNSNPVMGLSFSGAGGQSRPNVPLQLPPPLRNSPLSRTNPTSVGQNTPQPWSRARLAAERAAFFDTRVQGRAETWAAIKLVCEMLRLGDVSGAQGVLDAAGCTCPSGRVDYWAGEGSGNVRRMMRGNVKDRGGGVFDERGELYRVPAWVVRDPDDVVEDGADAAGQLQSVGAGVDGCGDKVEDFDSESEEDEEVMEMKREQKGKGRAVEEGKLVEVRARLSDRGTDVVVQVGRSALVKLIARKIADQAGVDLQTTKIRLAYFGRILDMNQTLDSQGWHPGHVVNGLVSDIG